MTVPANGQEVSNLAIRLTALMLVSIATMGPLHAAVAVWQPAAGGAVAILPPPNRASGILGGSLWCSEEQWGLLLRSDATETPDGEDVDATLEAGPARFAVISRQERSSIRVPLPFEAIGPLIAGARMKFYTADRAIFADFTLSGSKRAIEAVMPLCGAAPLPPYETADPSPDDGDAVAAAGPLVADEVSLFRAATGDEPMLSASTFAIEDNSLLFARLCGSTRYYGRSGCTTRGFAKTGAGPWREVYGNEGVRIYVDPSVGNGFPDLLTRPMFGGGAPDRWRWNGDGYEIADDPVTGAVGGAAAE